MPITLPDSFKKEQVEQLIQAIASAVIHTATYERRLTPHAQRVEGPATVTIPDKTKSFNIINLGAAGTGENRQDLLVSGISGLTAIPQLLQVFGYTIENDQNLIAGPIDVVVPDGHIVVIQYLL